MDLIYIYGPPGVGKFTTATELSKITGYRVFHNQLSIEFVRSVFKFGNPSFNKLVLKFRSETLEEAAMAGVSVIFTSLYAKGPGDKIVKDIEKRVKRHGGRVCFIRLYCEKEELKRRIGSRSRKGFYKIRSSRQLEGLLKRYNLLSSIPFENSLVIDNTKIPPKKVAQRIAEHYRLKKLRK